MRSEGDERGLWHICLRGDRGAEGGELGSPRGVALQRARLNDQQRLAVVFQGAALLAHLDHAGFYLATGDAAEAWRDATVSTEGMLEVSGVRWGRAPNLPQTYLKHLLLDVFQAEKEVVGRGTARRVARRHAERWHHRLIPVSLDLVVADLLDAAEFLWTPAFAYARRALVAEHGRGGQRRLWVVGPGRCRRRLMKRLKQTSTPSGEHTRAHLQALVASDEAKELWQGFDLPANADPWDLYKAGKWPQAASVWSRKARKSPADTLALARCLRLMGRSSAALALVQRRRDAEGLLLKARCQMDLNERKAAERTVGRLLGEDLDGMSLVSLAEMRIRLAAAGYRRETVRQWLGKLLALKGEPARTAGLIVAAGAAFDVGEAKLMGQYLDQAKGPALDQAPDLLWQWHQQEGLRRWQAGDGPGAAEHLTRALAVNRRGLMRFQAARLWNDLAVARQSAGDLAGAERACRHSLRLFTGGEGKTRHTLGLFNLAEIRVRRGLLRGVVDILERSIAENRLSGNRRGQAYDLELWARYELAQGRPTAALARCAEARLQGEVCNSGTLDVLAARAYGRMGEPEKASLRLDRCDPEAVNDLDEEERPVVWALAGRGDEARRQATGTPWQELFVAVTAAMHPPSWVWSQVDTLEPYRAARLFFDLELLLPGVVPPSRLRQALALFRERGFDGLVEVIEQRSMSPWQALSRYWADEPTPEAPANLLRDAGYGGVRLLLRDGEGRETVLMNGEGPPLKGNDPGRLQARMEDRLLVLENPEGAPDPVLETLFRALCRDLGGGSSWSEDLRTAATEGEEPPGDRSAIDRQGILGNSEALLRALTKVDKLAKGDLSVLILGESGTGKELIARRVHRRSPRYAGPFVTLNCAAVAESLINSTLFGHVRGAFTGADQNRAGIFESARGGTVFLDEIGDLPQGAQGNLLRVLQEGEIRRVGESLPRKVDVRIVAATHCDLATMVAAKTFRQDLYFRLRVAKVELPPLRERNGDVLLLAEHFATRERGARLSREAKKILLAHTWPGNIRELEGVIKVAATYADFNRIDADHLAEAGLTPGQVEDAPAPVDEVVLNQSFAEQIEDHKKSLLAAGLKRHGGNQSAAARELKMTRQSLSYLARKFGLL